MSIYLFIYLFILLINRCLKLETWSSSFPPEALKFGGKKEETDSSIQKHKIAGI